MPSFADSFPAARAPGSPSLTRLAAAALSALVVIAAPAMAQDCSEKVAEAFTKQREARQFRMSTQMVDERGVVLMTIDYDLPFKMRQTIQVLNEPKPKEVVVVGDAAWANAGDGWARMDAEVTAEIREQMRVSVIEPGRDPLTYLCSGEADVAGGKAAVFVGTERDKSGTPTPGLPERRIYVDSVSGLPLRNEVAPVGKPDKPFFRAAYSYPKDLVINPPTEVR
ncbi:MAG: hypothetical protein NW205_04885 [Hyphomicrobiaceae bacterium]|nr:hypothetical protein [Hyphomicrobiaceae bacterium]